MQENTRTQRTYDLLLKALTDLLAEKPFDEIRVTDLCERAGVHRSTFYAHFEDKRHLLTFGIQELMDIFLGTPSPPPSQQDFQRALRRVFKYFLKNKQEYTHLFLDPRNASAKALFRAEYIRAFKGLLKHRFPQVPGADLDLYSHYFIGGLLTVVDFWLENDTTSSPQEMAAQFVQLIPNHEDIFAARYPKKEPTR